jgi:hypothetical protein
MSAPVGAGGDERSVKIRVWCGETRGRDLLPKGPE